MVLQWADDSACNQQDLNFIAGKAGSHLKAAPLLNTLFLSS